MPDAKTARVSVVWAMVLIGIFYIMTTFLGFGAATIVGRDYIASHGGNNMSAPLLAQALGGDIFFAFIAAIAFATILAVVAGLTISASTSFAHDFYTNVIHHGKERKPGEEVRVARITAFVVGAVSIGLAILLGKDANVAFLVGLAFAVAASANLPVIVLSLFWKRFNTTGAVCGLAIGLLASFVLIIISPSIMKIDPPEPSRRGPSSHSAPGDFPAGESRHPQHSARISRRHPRHLLPARTGSRSAFRRATRPRQHRPRRGESDDGLAAAEPKSWLFSRSPNPRSDLLSAGAAQWGQSEQRCLTTNRVNPVNPV